MSVLDIIWRRNLHQQVSARSLISPDLIVVPERKSRLVRIDPETGSLVWDVRVVNTWGWLAVSTTQCFWLNQHSLLQSFDLATGELAWERNLSGSAGSTFGFLVVHEGLLLTGGWRGYTDLLALEASSGEEIWRLQCRNAPILHPVSTPYGIALPSRAGEELRLFASTGKLNRSLAFPAETPQPDNTQLVASEADRLFVATMDGTYWTLRTDMGEWEPLFMHLAGISTFCPVIVGQRIVFVDRQRHLQVYGIDGRHHWSVQWSHNRRDTLPAQVATADDLVVGGSFGVLAIFDHDGLKKASKQIGKRINTNIVVTRSGSVVLGTTGEMLGLKGTGDA